MPESFDAAAYLATGRPAVENLQNYVWACHQLGYHHPDLTLHPGQLRDWYGTEDGLDLGVLARDCAALEDALRASQDALAGQDRQLAQLSAAWEGAGADAATGFLHRHAEASTAVTAMLRAAAHALAALGEELRHAVGAKADAATSIEERTAPARTEWLAAAATVTTGAGDRAAAAELVDQAVKPFVVGPVATEWLTAMKHSVASVSAAYERSLADIGGDAAPVFGVPGDLGPVRSAARESDCNDEVRCPENDEVRCPEPAAAPAFGSAPAAPNMPTTPAAWSAPEPPPTAPVPAAPVPTAPVPTAPVPAAPVPTAPPPAPVSGMGAGLPDLGSGLSGLGSPFADMLGGLLGGTDSGLPEPDLPGTDLDEDEPGLDEPDLREDEDEPDEDEDEGEDGEPVDDIAATSAPGPAEEQPCESPAEPVEETAAPTPVPAPPPAEPLPPAEPAAADQTPCEIAADEVPQVGEPAG